MPDDDLFELERQIRRRELRRFVIFCAAALVVVMAVIEAVRVFSPH